MFGKIKSLVLESIYALILHHALVNGKPVKDNPALGGTACPGGNGIVYKLTNEIFDIRLQTIIYLYLISMSESSS